MPGGSSTTTAASGKQNLKLQFNNYMWMCVYDFLKQICELVMQPKV